MGFSDLDCFGSANHTISVFACMGDSSGVGIYAVVFFGLYLIFVAGWSYFYTFSQGLMVGSLFASLLGLAFYLLEWIPLVVWMTSVTLLLVGIALVILQTKTSD